MDRTAPDDKTEPQGTPPGSDPSLGSGEAARRRGLTPEQRRLLGSARTRSDRPQEPAQIPAPENEAPSASPEPPAKERISASTESADESRPSAHPVTVLRPDQESSRIFELQKAVLIIGCLLLLAVVFYLGTKVPYWLYLYRSHQKQKVEASRPEKFPGVSSDDLVEEALRANAAGRWREAGERLLEARRKNSSYRGIFLMVGMLCFEHGDLGTADSLFANAITAGENLDGANSFRARIAMRRNDDAAAERFCEAAAAAAPFVWGNYYQWAEVLRMNRNPREAIRRYEQAALRAPRGSAVIDCLYKVRLARIEARDSKVGDDIAEKAKEGPLPADWLVTDAALKIDQGNFAEALQQLTAARAATTKDSFSFYVSDMFFKNAADKDPGIAAICRTDSRPAKPFP